MPATKDNRLPGHLRAAAEMFLRAQGLPAARVVSLELNGPSEYWALIIRAGRAETVVIRGPNPDVWEIDALFAGWPVPEEAA